MLSSTLHRKVQYTLKEERLAQIIFENPGMNIYEIIKLFYKGKKVDVKFPREALTCTLASLTQKMERNKEKFSLYRERTEGNGNLLSYTFRAA